MDLDSAQGLSSAGSQQPYLACPKGADSRHSTSGSCVSRRSSLCLIEGEDCKQALIHCPALLLIQSYTLLQVIEKALKKLKLDAMVIQQGRMQDSNKTVGKDDLLQMVRYGAELVFSGGGGTVTDEDIDAIISKASRAAGQAPGWAGGCCAGTWWAAGCCATTLVGEGLPGGLLVGQGLSCFWKQPTRSGLIHNKRLCDVKLTLCCEACSFIVGLHAL